MEPCLHVQTIYRGRLPVRLSPIQLPAGDKTRGMPSRSLGVRVDDGLGPIYIRLWT